MIPISSLRVVVLPAPLALESQTSHRPATVRFSGRNAGRTLFLPESNGVVLGEPLDIYCVHVGQMCKPIVIFSSLPAERAGKDYLKAANLVVSMQSVRTTAARLAEGVT